MKAPEKIYLVPGEFDGEQGLVWCEDPAPGVGMRRSESTGYIREDRYDAAIWRIEQLESELSDTRRYAQSLRQESLAATGKPDLDPYKYIGTGGGDP